MSKQLSKLTTAVNSLISSMKPSSSSSQIVKSSRSKKRQRGGSKRITRQANMRVPRGILAGYGSAITSSFYTTHSGDGCVVRGIDLVTSPFVPGNGISTSISYFIPANPASWNGTRIAAVAAGFQNYRPLQFKIHYRPQTGSTSQISMFIGTLWQDNYIKSRPAVEPSLVTSPGGTYLPAWQSSTSIVPLGRNLPMRMYPIRDPTFQQVPFSILARAADGGPNAESIEMPGRIFIEYTYRFNNAIGSGSGFQPSKMYRVRLIKTDLYSGTTALMTAWIFNTNADSLTIDNDSGWIIDSGSQGETALDVFPIGSKLTFDFIVASTTSGGTARRVAIAKINGANPDINGTIVGSPTQVTLAIYSEGDDPDA